MQRYVDDTPPADTAERIERALGTRPIAWRRAHGGIAPTERWSVTLPGARAMFVKIGTTEHTNNAIRAEALLLPHIRADLAPRFGGFEDGDPPMIWIEDLSHAAWPPPWSRERIESVLATLTRLRRLPPPDGARSAERFRQALDHWEDVERDPTSFLATGLATEAWLRRVLPTMRLASDAARLEGDDLLHMDVRSDNMCFADGRTVLVDWNFASIGNGDFDVAAWLGSLHAEGGPLPEEILPGAGEAAAFIAGYFAWSAGQPPLEGVPLLRPIQMKQLRAVLPWACRELGLPQPDLMDGATR